MKPQEMRCGQWLGATQTSGGFGMPLRSAVARCGPRCLGVARTRGFCSAKDCGSRVGSRAILRTSGGRTRVLLPSRSISQGSGIPRRSSGNICRYVRGSSVVPGRRAVFRNRCRCLTASSDYSVIAMNSGCFYKAFKATSETLPKTTCTIASFLPSMVDWSSGLGSTSMMAAHARMILFICWSQSHIRLRGRNTSAGVQNFPLLKTT
jgi:hypothetical protein